MKNLLLIFCMFIGLVLNAQIINFPDLNLKSKLLSSNNQNGVAYDSNGISIKIDSNSNNEIEITEALEVKYLHMYNANITQLDGLNFFTNLIFLDVRLSSINNLLPISNLVGIEYLYCGNNQLTNLIGLENFTALKSLEASFNQISSLSSISNCINITNLQITQNSLTLLTPIQNLINLLYLDCSHNNLVTLSGIENATSLITLYCSFNNLNSLSSIENLISLQLLNADNNNLSFANFNNLSSLTELYLNNNQFLEINISGTSVYKLKCENNASIQTLKLKNNIITQPFFKHIGVVSSPPPLISNFNFINTPNLTFICYDDGEESAIQSAFEFNTIPSNITLSTDCNLLNTNYYFYDNDFVISPNPVKNELTFIFNPKINKINLYSIQGQIITTIINPQKTIDVSNLKAGTYFITLSTEEGNITKKFIKI